VRYECVVRMEGRWNWLRIMSVDRLSYYQFCIFRFYYHSPSPNPS